MILLGTKEVMWGGETLAQSLKGMPEIRLSFICKESAFISLNWAKVTFITKKCPKRIDVCQNSVGAKRQPSTIIAP